MENRAKARSISCYTAMLMRFHVLRFVNLSGPFEICVVIANAWEEGDEVVLITCRLENPDLDKVNGHQSD